MTLEFARTWQHALTVYLGNPRLVAEVERLTTEFFQHYPAARSPESDGFIRGLALDRVISAAASGGLTQPKNHAL